MLNSTNWQTNKIESAVVVVVEPHGARAPSRRRDSGLLRHIGERAVAVVVIQNASPILRHVDVGEAVAVVIAHRDALAIASGANARLLRDVGKSAVAIVAIERIAQRRLGIIEVALPAVDQIDVHPSVIVVVQKGAARAGGFRQIFLSRLAGCVCPGDPARGRQHLFKRIRRCGQNGRDIAHSGECSSAPQRPEEAPARQLQRISSESSHCGFCGPCGFWAFGPPMRSAACCCKANSRCASSLRPVRE